jgi:hypothetical protein
MSLSVADLERLGSTALQEFAETIAPGRVQSDVEAPAKRMEAKLEQLYGIAVTLAQREESLSAVAEIWAEMVTICDQMAKALGAKVGLTDVRSEAYDRILDIRNACEENRALHA